MRSLHWLAMTAVVAAAVTAVLRADAQMAPTGSRPVTLVVPIAPGGGVDTLARIFAPALAERLKQPWVVENRPGAGGALGLESVARAAADGHTMLMIETSAVLQKWLHKDVRFDVVADFAPVAQIATTPLLLFASPALPVADFRALIAYARANPGRLAVGTPGIGTPHHLAAAMLNAQARIDITHVPYKGTAPALNDLLAGQIPLIWATPNVVMQFVEAGKVKPLAVGSPERIALLPEVPTVAESGIAGFDVGVWFGIAAPVKTSQYIVLRVSDTVAKITAVPELRQKLKPLGYDLDYLDSWRFGDKVAADFGRYGKVIRDAGIAPE